MPFICTLLLPVQTENGMLKFQNTHRILHFSIELQGTMSTIDKFDTLVRTLSADDSTFYGKDVYVTAMIIRASLFNKDDNDRVKFA